MESEFFFFLAVIIIIAIFAIFVLCMYLREFPKVKTDMKIDMKNNDYEFITELDKVKNLEKNRANR